MKLRQPVENHDDMRKVTDDMLRECGLSIDDGGGKVTFQTSQLFSIDGGWAFM